MQISWQADRIEAGGEPDTTVGDQEMTLLSVAPPSVSCGNGGGGGGPPPPVLTPPCSHHSSMQEPPESRINNKDVTEHIISAHTIASADLAVSVRHISKLKPMIF